MTFQNGLMGRLVGYDEGGELVGCVEGGRWMGMLVGWDEGESRWGLMRGEDRCSWTRTKDESLMWEKDWRCVAGVCLELNAPPSKW